jgi:ADP-ribose pyrophosphatase YjhB (NUDIX family)
MSDMATPAGPARTVSTADPRQAQAYTHPSVLAGIAAGTPWADPVMDPSEIDWDKRPKPAIPFRVVDGRPENPFEDTGIPYGRNEMGHWGERLMADAVTTVIWNGARHILLVERDDGHGYAVPGGHVEARETGHQAAVRELAEETHLALLTGNPASDAVLRELARKMPLTFASASAREAAPRYVPDPRGSNEAWAVTIALYLDLGTLPALPAVAGGDDARRAMWLPAGSYQALAAAVASISPGAVVFAAHVPMLTEFLG